MAPPPVTRHLSATRCPQYLRTRRPRDALPLMIIPCGPDASRHAHRSQARLDGPTPWRCLA